MKDFNKKSVLICIPSYNAESSIKETIQSALNQSTKSTFKILIVDNNSTDNTRKIVEEMLYKNRDSKNIELFVNSLNIGRIPNWNKCIELFLDSDFDYLKFLFTGDILEKDCLENLLDGFRRYEYKPGIVVGSYNCIENGIIKKIQQINKENYLTSKDGLMLFVKKGNWVGAPLSCMFSRDSLQHIRFNNEFDYVADLIFFINLITESEALCINKIVGNFSILERKHFQKYRSNLFAKIEELHAKYIAFEKLKMYISDLEKDKLTKSLNQDTARVIIFYTSFIDSMGIFIYKIRMSLISLLHRFKRYK